MERNLSEYCVANFQHMADVYPKEATMALKKAHELGDVAFHPKTIEKWSARLFNAVFHDTTKNALQYYSESEDRYQQ